MSSPARKMVACPRCDGFQEADEDGRFFSCYFCFDELVVEEAVAVEERRRVAWAAHVRAENLIRRRVEMGIPAGWSYYYDEESGEVVVRPPRREAPVFSDVWDDIPF